MQVIRCLKHLPSVLSGHVMQVIEDLNAIAMRDGKPLEAVITEGMQHPNIVNTIAHTVQHTPHLQRRPHDSAQSSLAGTSDVPCKSGSLASRNKARQGVQSEGIAWLLLEYCDMGCLQVNCLPSQVPGLLRKVKQGWLVKHRHLVKVADRHMSRCLPAGLMRSECLNKDFAMGFCVGDLVC